MEKDELIGDIKDMVVQGDALDILRKLPDDCINSVVTSPPYWSQRDYQVDGQLGLETTIGEYLDKLLQIFSEVHRVLKNTGSCWINISDCYNDKSLCLIPERFAIRMVDSGWILRNVIIWEKRNCMPESVKDRFTRNYEYLYFFVKQTKYYFEQQFEKSSNSFKVRAKYPINVRDTNPAHLASYMNNIDKLYVNPRGRNKRSVWSLPSCGSRWYYCKHCDSYYMNVGELKTKNVCNKCGKTDGWISHFATFPECLITVPIIAGCEKQGIVLDPFIGSGTTAVVAVKNNRHYLGIDLNQDYINIVSHRLRLVDKQLVFLST